MLEVLTKQNLREYYKVYPPLQATERYLIESLFGEEIRSMSNNRLTSTHLAERLFGFALDRGLREKAIFLDVIAEDKKELEPVAMLNRQSFLSELRKKIGFKEAEKLEVFEYSTEKNFSIFQIDLANLRKADETIDIEGNSAADYDLNIVASALTEFVSELTNIGGFNIDSKDIIVGRYGGDEFSVALIGDLSQNREVVLQFKKLIKEKIEGKQGYFKEDGKILKKNLKLKENKVDVVMPPEGEEQDGLSKKKIFFSFLKRGMVLSNKQLDFEIEYIKQTNGNNVDKYLKEVLFDDTEYSQLENQEKIKYLTERHPELKVPFYLAALKNDEGDNERQTKILHFIENYLTDPLLNELIISRFDLLSHMKRENFNTVHSFELKLKEINDNLSYVYADQVVMHLWKNQLKTILDQYIKEGKVKIGRFAGTIFIGEIGEGLPPDIRDKLTKISEVTLRYKNKDLTHLVGYAEIDTKDKEGELSDLDIKQKINKVFNKPTEDWLKKVFKRVFDNRTDFNEVQDIYKKINSEFIYEGENYFALIVAKYFNGKRWKARSEVALRVLDLMKNEYEKEVVIMKELFNKQKPKLVIKYKDE